MVKARNEKADDIQTALSKLKNESNAKELELIELVANVYETVKEGQDKAVGKVVDTAATVNNSVRNHPWAYVGAAAVAGFLLGMFSRRCNSVNK